MENEGDEVERRVWSEAKQNVRKAAGRWAERFEEPAEPDVCEQRIRACPPDVLEAGAVLSVDAASDVDARDEEEVSATDDDDDADTGDQSHASEGELGKK